MKIGLYLCTLFFLLFSTHRPTLGCLSPSTKKLLGGAAQTVVGLSEMGIVATTGYVAYLSLTELDNDVSNTIGAGSVPLINKWITQQMGTALTRLEGLVFASAGMLSLAGLYNTGKGSYKIVSALIEKCKKIPRPAPEAEPFLRLGSDTSINPPA
jgi:hypothetical protein